MLKQEYPVNAEAPQGSILGLTVFLLYINEPPDDVICNIAIYADDTILYSKCDQGSDLCQQLVLASELEANQQDTVDQGGKWLVDFNAGKTQLVLFHLSNNTGAIDVMMDGSVFEEKQSFTMLGLTISSKLDWGSISLAKSVSKTNWSTDSFHEVSFSWSCSVIYINLPNGHAWNAVMSELELLAATWNCYISCKNG